MKKEAEKRAMEVWSVIDAVAMAFYRTFEKDGKYYSIKRIFWDQTMVVKDYDDSKCYMVSWAVNDNMEVSFTPESPEEWVEVEEVWQPVQERSMSAELRSLFGIENAGKEPEKRENTEKKEVKARKEQRNAHKAEIIESGPERRTFFGEVRAKGDKSEPTKITGYAAVFNEPTTILMRDGKGGYVEVIEEIAPGAFDDVLEDDVRALFNHDPNFILGRSTAGTLNLFIDERGLGYEIDVPDTAIGRDLLKSIARGDVSQSSFGFEVGSDNWSVGEDGTDRRKITRLAQLYDVSPVTYPAYTTTEAAARSRGAVTDESVKTMSSGYQTPDWYKYKMLAKKRV